MKSNNSTNESEHPLISFSSCFFFIQPFTTSRIQCRYSLKKSEVEPRRFGNGLEYFSILLCGLFSLLFLSLASSHAFPLHFLPISFFLSPLLLLTCSYSGCTFPFFLLVFRHIVVLVISIFCSISRN